MQLKPANDDGTVMTLELDHGRANEMGSTQLKAIEAFTATLESGTVRALVTFSRRVSRKGTPIFVAGADVTERVDWDDDHVKEHVRWQRAVLARWRRAPVFHVAVVHGVALGWGTELLLTTDYAVATPGARFGLPETGLGIVPGAGGTAELWSRIGVAQALRLGMTGEPIGADEALRIGLVQECCDDLDAGLTRAHALASAVARRSPTAVAAFKRGVLDSIGVTESKRTAIEDIAYSRCVDTGDAAVGRANFKAVVEGQPAPWGPLVTEDDPH
ncbi:MAG: enoyl-CoA hydratase/isomerase family protein [Myxococcota bacterium]